jgi:hypothetical protein
LKQKIVTIVFTDNEIEDFNNLVEQSGVDGAPNMIKRIIREYFGRIPG